MPTKFRIWICKLMGNISWYVVLLFNNLCLPNEAIADYGPSTLLGLKKLSKHITFSDILLSHYININFFFFSVFYVFFEQYLTIWSDTVHSLSYTLLCIFGTTFIVTGFSIFCAFIVTLTATMIILHMMGMMWLCSIPLNAVSLVNLVMVSLLIHAECVKHSHVN